MSTEKTRIPSQDISTMSDRLRDALSSSVSRCVGVHLVRDRWNGKTDKNVWRVRLWQAWFAGDDSPVYFVTTGDSIEPVGSLHDRFSVSLKAGLDLMTKTITALEDFTL